MKKKVLQIFIFLLLSILSLLFTNPEVYAAKKYSAPLTFSKADLYHTTANKGKNYLAGTISAYEKINNSKVKLSKAPKITLQSTDGKFSQSVYVYKDGNKYFFSFCIDNLNLSKKYTLKIKSGNSNNTHKAQSLSITDEYISATKKIHVTTSKNTLTFSNTYSAPLTFSKADLYYTTANNGKNYLAGTISAYEKINNSKVKLSKAPKITLQSTDGKFSQSVYVYKDGNKYFFSFCIDNLNLSKKYTLKIKSGNSNNTHKAQTLAILNDSISIDNKYMHAAVKSNSISLSKNCTTVSKGTYGYSGLYYSSNKKKGSKLEYYKIGTGPNVLFAVFELHGYEDLWAKDGQELVYIAEDFVKQLGKSNDKYIANNWTVYVFPKANPDGLNYGHTNNGPGRTTVYSTIKKGIDLNRCWSTNFKANYSARNYTGSSAFAAYEARFLRDFMIKNKSKKGQTIVIDLHGWTTQLIGDKGICLNYYGPQFYGSYKNSLSKYTSSYGKGYMINWARNNLSNNKGVKARSALIELPSAGIKNHQSVVKAKYSQKYYNATIKMLKNILK